ncbi:hypothetical protein QVD17_40563 [Tagetes erecta]|uniref:Uncharacterized protein n=1 Tax=Tagetes erecta TaxID=13708 RepID=A0AAD8JS89_TARER|nr:hypothetical protein QVD17_40563 [Tagetes erecta]
MMNQTEHDFKEKHWPPATLQVGVYSGLGLGCDLADGGGYIPNSLSKFPVTVFFDSINLCGNNLSPCNSSWLRAKAHGERRFFYDRGDEDGEDNNGGCSSGGL